MFLELLHIWSFIGSNSHLYESVFKDFFFLFSKNQIMQKFKPNFIGIAHVILHSITMTALSDF